MHTQLLCDICSCGDLLGMSYYTCGSCIHLVECISGCMFCLALQIALNMWAELVVKFMASCLQGRGFTTDLSWTHFKNKTSRLLIL